MAKRRRALLTAAASGVASSLAGCLDGGDDDGERNESNQTATSPDYDGPNATPTAATAYPQYQYDAANTGAVPSVRGPTGGIGSAFEFGDGGSDRRMGSPSLADGTVYVAEAVADGNDTGQTTVHAVDAADGTGEWAATYPNTTAAGPTAVAGDRVLAGVGGSVVCLDAASGEQRWALACGRASGVTVTDEALYVVGVDAGTTTLYSLAVTDGTERWRAAIDAERYRPTPAVADGTVYVGGTALQALDAASGTEQWRTDHAVSAAPTVADGEVVVGSTGSLRVYETSDGTEQWSVELDEEAAATVADSPAVAAGAIYVAVAGEMRAYDRESSEQLYAVEHDVGGAPVVADDHLYVLDAGRLLCLATADGSTAWSYSTQQHTDPGGVAPAVVEGVAYFPAERLYAIAD